MAPLPLILLAGATGLLVVGAEGPPPGTQLVGAGGPWLDTPGEQDDITDELWLSDDDVMSGDGVSPGLVRCAICQRVVKALRKVVVDPNSKAGVARVTHRVCSLMPVGAGLCRRLLHHALAAIERGLKKHEDPTTLCTHLRWCHHQP